MKANIVSFSTSSNFLPLFRSSHQKCSIKKADLINSAIFTRKHLRWSLFLIKLQAFSEWILLTLFSTNPHFLERFPKLLFWDILLPIHDKKFNIIPYSNTEQIPLNPGGVDKTTYPLWSFLNIIDLEAGASWHLMYFCERDLLKFLIDINYSIERYSRMDQTTFFKGCLPQILLGPFLNTLSHISPWSSIPLPNFLI